MAFSHDGRGLVSGNFEGSARIRDASNGEALAMLSAVQGARDRVVVTPEGLFDGSEDGVQKLVAWRIGNGIYPPD